MFEDQNTFGFGFGAMKMCSDSGVDMFIDGKAISGESFSLGLNGIFCSLPVYSCL